LLGNLIYSINCVVPILLIVLFGKLLSKTSLLSEKFYSDSERLVFKAALPAMLFMEITKADLKTVFDVKYILFCVIGIFLTFLIPCLIVPLFIKGNDSRGAFVQGVYRSNFAILGITLAENMFGDSGTQQIAVVMPFAIMLFNIFAVTILSIYAPKEENIKFKDVIKKIILNIVKNPLIISIVLAFPFLIFSIELPAFLTKSVTYISNLTTPLALISLGAGFKFETVKEKFPMALTASIIKTVVLPLALVFAAVLLGYRNEQLGVVFILFGGPTAVTSYIMAKNMKSDYELAGFILILTTIMCSFTLFVGVFILKSTGLI